MSRSVWLEVALNGAAGKGYQPLIPISVEDIVKEGVECVKAGAQIVHVHAYDEQGRPTEDVDVYTRIIEGILSKVDAIVYPTLGLQGTLQQRYAPIQELMKRGLLEWSVVDPGSVNITHVSQINAGEDGIAYLNPDSHIRHGLELAAFGGWRPAYAIYEPGFLRLGAAMASHIEKLKTPVYRLMFSDRLLFGCAPTLKALEFYHELLQSTVPNAPWMLSGLDADVSELMLPALEMGAHLRVGLEDAPFGSVKSNLDLVSDATKLVSAQNIAFASLSEIRMFD